MSTQFKFTFADLPPNVAHYFPDGVIPDGAAAVGCNKREKKLQAEKFIGPPNQYDARWEPFVERAAKGCLASQHALYIRDCLRAGHKYGQNELNITPDAITPRYAPYQAHSMSMTGSHAAMCASIA